MWAFPLAAGPQAPGPAFTAFPGGQVERPGLEPTAMWVVGVPQVCLYQRCSMPRMSTRAPLPHTHFPPSDVEDGRAVGVPGQRGPCSPSGLQTSSLQRRPFPARSLEPAGPSSGNSTPATTYQRPSCTGGVISPSLSQSPCRRLQRMSSLILSPQLPGWGQSSYLQGPPGASGPGAPTSILSPISGEPVESGGTPASASTPQLKV